MKDVNLLIWLSQLGLSVAAPPALFILLAVYLHKTCAWGVWVIWVGIALGVYCAVTGFISSMKALSRMSKSKKETHTGVSFNEHD